MTIDNRDETYDTQLDDIDGRAAQLMERMAAQRSRLQAPPTREPEAVPEQSTAPRPDEPETYAEHAEPAVQPATTHGDEPGDHRPPRVMAAPPWQSGSGTSMRIIRPHRHSAEERTAQVSPDIPQPVLPAPGWHGLPAWMPPPPAPPGTPDAGPPEYVSYAPPPLDDAQPVVRGTGDIPQSGWRRTVRALTRGRVDTGMSQKDRDQQHLLDQIRQPIAGDFRIAVLSIKGGVGKTTTTLGLGSALATVRSDRIVAVDANPDRGTLAERVIDTSTSSSVRDLLRDAGIRRYADVRGHMRMATSRLEVLASEQDPAVAEVFGEADYRRTVDILRRYYNVILTDCGTGIMHSAMSGVLDLAHSIVLVSSPAIDAARSAAATLDWLVRHGYSDLARGAHVVLSASQHGSAVNVDRVVEHFGARCASIHVIPFERRLAEGADFDFAALGPATTQAYLELAGAVAENFDRMR